MKVILLQDVAKIGRRFDIANVQDGYALNKLIPQRLAKPATPENLKSIEAHARKTQDVRDKQQTAFEEALVELDGKTIEVAVEANEEGRMFQSLKVETIIAAVTSDTSIKLSEANLHIPTPIKEIGVHTVALVSGDSRGDLSLNLVAKK